MTLRNVGVDDILRKTYLVHKCIRKRLNAELERSKIRGFIKTLHLFSHKRLMDLFSFGIGGIH